MHGAGNDFLVVDERRFSDVEKELPAFARDVCRRNFSVGADGVVSFSKSQTAQVRMRYYNADGGRSVCGNGMRCLAALCLNPSFSSIAFPEFELESSGAISIETDSGISKLELVDRKSENESMLRANMGEPKFSPEMVPCLADEPSVALGKNGYRLEVGGRELNFHAVSMGNPHAVLIVDSLNREDFLNIAPLLEKHSFFSEGCNAHFVQFTGSNSCEILIWERGVGETLACGTGNAAIYAVARELGLIDKSAPLTLNSRGGEFLLESGSVDTRDVLITGPAKLAFRGSLDFEGLSPTD